MESKFKEGLYRFTLLFAAAMFLALAMTPQDAASRGVLGIYGLGLGIAALGYRRLPELPGATTPVLLALLLTLLLWLAPERHAMWLWGWAAILTLPQPLLLLLVHLLLATSCWWQMQRLTGIEPGLLSGLLLAALMLLGLARNLGLQLLWHEGSRHTRLMSNMMLRSGRQLAHDLPLETTRCLREGSHGELLLLRSSAMHQPTLASALTSATRNYEGCYQVDGQTLAALLISHDVSEARQRRDAILASLPAPRQARFVMLIPALSLSSQLTALSRQQRPVAILEESA